MREIKHAEGLKVYKIYIQITKKENLKLKITIKKKKNA